MRPFLPGPKGRFSYNLWSSQSDFSKSLVYDFYVCKVYQLDPTHHLILKVWKLDCPHINLKNILTTLTFAGADECFILMGGFLIFNHLNRLV